MRRVVAIVVVLALHVGLIAMFTMSRVARRDEKPDESRMTVVWLSLPSSQPDSRIIAPEAILMPPREGSTAITPPLTEIEREATRSQLNDVGQEATPPHEGEGQPPRIDWSNEARLAASRAVDSLNEQRRRDAAFSAPETSASLKKSPPPPPEFGWSRAHTHRIEALPEGGTLIRLNDRCALVLYVALFPVCSLGKIEARGDLFEHMRDPPQPEE